MIIDWKQQNGLVSHLEKRFREPTYIVGIGGSAGGLPAYKEFFKALPANSEMAFCVIAHMNPTGESLLVEVLSHATKMPVTEAANGMRMLAGHVYVIPPNADLSLDGLTFKVFSPRTMSRGKHKQVDIFLTSLAEHFGTRAIGIIVSGGDGDGAKGCQVVKEKGGIMFAQDQSAEIGSMPQHAFDSGYIDFVLPPTEIADALARMGTTLPDLEQAK
jgi:two-component system CheB/CheR fusion protein